MGGIDSNLTLLTPAARRRPRFPRASLVVLVLALAVSLAIDPGRSAAEQVVDAIVKAAAVLAGCAAGSWLEESIYGFMVGRAGWLRVMVALALPPAALFLAPLLSIPLGVPAAALGDDATLMLTTLAALGWVASAAVGSLVIVLLDVSISALVPDFRSRIQLAVLALLGLVVGAALIVFRGGQLVAEKIRAVDVSHVEEGWKMHVAGEDLTGGQVAVLLADPDTANMAASAFVFFMVLMALPAVLSASGKLAEAVMERLHPLNQAFDAVAAGRLEVRVEEAGSRDFRALNQRFNHMVTALGLARRMERAFGQYVSEQVLDRIRAQHGEASLPASLREASVFFADIRGFTSMSEKLEPAEVLGVLNRYFDRVVRIVDEHEGYLDKFVGDAVVVVFNGPIDQPDHAVRAARCAIALQREATAMSEAGLFPEVERLEVGVGVATGPLVAGNLGSARHMEFTVIGDTVNLASRLTGRAPAGEVWVNQANADALPAELDPQPLAPLSVKGKAQAVQAFRIWPPL